MMEATDKLRLLVVEDDPADALVVRKALAAAYAQAHPTVDYVRTVAEALTLLADGNYDAVLVDDRLASGDPAGALKGARGSGAITPAIVLTNLSDGAVAAKAMKSGAVDYLVKSHLKPATLVTSIRHAAQLHRSQLVTAASRVALAESEERFRRAIVGAPIPIMIHADDGWVVLVSKVWSDLTGYAPADLPTVSSWIDKAFPAARDRMKADINRLYSLDRPAHAGEWPVTTRTGSKLNWDFTSAPLGRMHDGRRLVITMAADTTERRALEAQFRQAQKMESVGRLAGGVAHDFNNLLTVILGAGDDLLAGLATGTSLRRSAETIVKAADCAAALTRQLLLFTRKRVANRAAVDLSAILADLRPMLERLVPAGVKVGMDLDPDVGRVHADAGEIEQIILNLVVNAQDAMPGGGVITIATRNTDAYLPGTLAPTNGTPEHQIELSVSDTGTGISAEVLPHIFEAFYTTKEAGKGTGLGLSTVYAIVTQLGGAISVSSEAGHGTTFRVLFPRAGKPAPLASAAPDSEPRPRGTETILVVEDEPAVREMIRSRLEAVGYTVIVAGDGDEALAAVRSRGKSIALLLTDIGLPGIGGRRLAEMVRGIQPGMQVLCMSGSCDDEMILRDVQRGSLAFVSKPFTPGTLCRRVREVLDAERQHESPSAHDSHELA